MYVRVEAADGLTGIGEATLEWRSASVAASIGELAPLLIGEDGNRIEHLWQVMVRSRRHRGGAIELSAISGVEQALWDIKGKRAGMPVYELLGGACRDHVEVYANAPHEETAAGMVAAARGLVAMGFSAIKLGSSGIGLTHVDDPHALDIAVDALGSVRDAVGPNVRIAVDCCARMSPATASRFAHAIEPLAIWFLEEPVRAENPAALLEVARRTSIPIAAGEQLLTRWGFRELLALGAVALVQPDVAHCGGIAEARRIAAMAEVEYCGFAPHNPLSPVNTLASAHVAMATPNFVALELKVDTRVPWLEGADVPWRDAIIDPPLRVQNGWLEVPRAPGLGANLELGVCSAHPPREIALQTVDYRRPDGSFSDC